MDVGSGAKRRERLRPGELDLDRQQVLEHRCCVGRVLTRRLSLLRYRSKRRVKTRPTREGCRFADIPPWHHHTSQRLSAAHTIGASTLHWKACWNTAAV
jgi:hypothetical protein